MTGSNLETCPDKLMEVCGSLVCVMTLATPMESVENCSWNQPWNSWCSLFESLWKTSKRIRTKMALESIPYTFSRFAYLLPMLFCDLFVFLSLAPHLTFLFIPILHQTRPRHFPTFIALPTSTIKRVRQDWNYLQFHGSLLHLRMYQSAFTRQILPEE